MAARQSAAEAKRGGGESGWMERGKSEGFASSIGDVTAAEGATVMHSGITKAIGLTSERSVS
jgi:hypothetical protein